eukprot:symbB.v1.2.010891.t1/scaffold720.1/size169259/2
MSHVAVPCSFDCSQADGQCPLQDGVCLAILAQPEHQREIVVRVKHILKHQRFQFADAFLVVDSREPVPESLAVNAQKLVEKGWLHNYFVVNYSAEYVERINQTANLDPEEHPPDKHWKFNYDYEEQVQMAHYFAIDQCKERYLALVNIDVLFSMTQNFSWIEAGLEILRSNEGLVLVMPAFPGVEHRNAHRIRSRPSTKSIEKVHKTLESPSFEAEDTTCDHPYTLAGWVSLLDLQRYDAVGPRQKVREHRCGGQLVKGKKCASFESIRGCGGMRHWEYALECAICNRADLRQAQLTNWRLAWVQKAPLIRFRSDVTEMVRAMKALENGSMAPRMGMDFAANWTTG